MIFDGKGRVILAAAIAPVLAGSIAILILASASVMEQTAIDTKYLDFELFGMLALVGGGLGLILGWPAMLVAGLPIHKWLAGQGSQRLLWYVLLGVPVGIATMLVYYVPALLTESAGRMEDYTSFLEVSWDNFLLLMPGPLTGAISAALFWWIRRPDRMTRSTAQT